MKKPHKQQTKRLGWGAFTTEGETMKTYSIYESYQAAKIENPDCNVFTNGWLFVPIDSESVNDGSAANVTHSFEPCLPADYCESIHEFLSQREFVGGDMYIDQDGEVVRVGEDINLEHANRKNLREDKACHVLWAAAYEKEKEEFARLAREHDNEKNQAIEMDTTPQQVESLANGEPEWKNGDSVVFGRDDRRGIYVAYDNYNEGHVIYSGGDYYYVLSGDFKKPETPEQKAEREKKEKAIIALREAIQECEEAGLPVYYGEESVTGATIIDSCAELE